TRRSQLSRRRLNPRAGNPARVDRVAQGGVAIDTTMADDAHGCEPSLEILANKIGASTPFDFSGKNLTPYGGLLPVATMLEKLGFQALMEETVLVKRLTKVMSGYHSCSPWC